MTYSPWRYADRSYVRERAGDRFRARAERLDQAHAYEDQRRAQQAQVAAQAQPQPTKKRESGGGWLDSIGDAIGKVADEAEDAAKTVGEGVMTALDAPGRAVRGVIHKTTGLDLNEYVDNPDNPAFFRVLAGAATDPLTYVGPGAVAKGLRLAPAAVRASRGAKWAAAALEAPRRAAIGGALGAAVAGQAAQSADAPGWVQTGAQLGGGVLGGGLAMRGHAPVLAAAEESGIRKSPDLMRIPHGEIEERPDLFQARNADPGKSYSESRVAELEAQFDPNQLEPGSLVRDTSTGKLVVFSGHHRRELMKRMAAKGQMPGEGTWEMFEADLSNPAHVEALQKLADYKNYGVATTNLEENVRVYRRARDRGEEKGAILDQMRSVDKVQRNYLDVLADMPDDLIKRATEGNASVANLGEIAKAARTYKFNEREIRAIYGRYIEGVGKGITPTALSQRLERAGRDIQELRANTMQGSFMDVADGGTEWEDAISKGLTRIDDVESAEAEVRLKRLQLTRVNKQLSELGNTDADLLPEITAVRDRIQSKLAQLEADAHAARTAYERDKAGGFRPTTDEGLPEGDRGGGAEDRGSAPLPGQTGLFGGEPAGPVEQTVKRRDLFGNETDTFQTEAELGGFREKQGDLLGRGEDEAKLRAYNESGTAIPEEAPGPVPNPAMHPPEAAAAQAEGTREWQAAHPERPPVENGRYKDFDRPEDVLEQLDQDIADYSPRWNTPTPTLSKDYRKIKMMAQSKLRRLYLNEIAEVEGYDSVKEMPKELQRAANRMARDAIKEAERNAVKPEWHDPNRPLVRQSGVASQSERQAAPPAAGTGAAAGSPPNQPPLGLKGQGTQPPLPPPTNTAMGSRARYGADLFRTEKPGVVRAREARYLGTGKGKLDQGIRRVFASVGGENVDKNLVKDTDVRPFVVDVRNRLKNITNSYEGLADVLWQRVEDSGLQLTRNANGDVVLPNGATFGDMVERSTPKGQAAYQALTPEQADAVDDIVDFNMKLNGNLAFHGKGMNFADADVEAAYFPRVVMGRNGVEKVVLTTTGKAPAGVGSSFLKDRIMASMEEGVNEGLNYADPRTAYRQMVRAKLRVAADAYVSSALKPLGKTADDIKRLNLNGFNYVELPPTVAPGLQGYYFPREMAERIHAALNGKPMVQSSIVKGVNTVLTPLRAVADISWLGQQGAPMLFRHPARAVQGTLAVLSDEFGGKGNWLRLIDQEAARGPGIEELISRGLHWVPDDVGEIGIGFKPGGKGIFGAIKDFSNRTFGRYLNYQRLVFANDAYERAMAMGLKGADLDRELKGAMDAVNRMSGFTGRAPTSLESMFEFAPRFFSSAVEQTAAALTKGGLEGSIARGHIGRMLGIGAITVIGANALRGYDTDLDPRSDNFLRIRNVGGLDVSPFGTYDTLFRAIAATSAGQSGEPLHPDIKRLWHLAESKMSPAVKLVYEPFIAGSTYNGEPLDPLGSWAGAGKAIYYEAKSSVPFGVQSAIEEGLEPAAEARDPRKIIEGAPGILASGIGLTNTPVTPSEKLAMERGDTSRRGPLTLTPERLGLPANTGAAQEQFGQPYQDLTGAEKSQINERPEIARRQAEVDRNTLSREDDRSRYLDATLGNASKLQALTESLDRGEITGNEFRDQYRQLQAEMRGVRGVLKAGGGQDDTIDGWFNLYDKASLPDGRMDWDTLEGLQDQYRAAHPDIDDKLLKMIGAHDNQTLRDFRAAQQSAREYYDLPAYRGMDVDQSRKASRAIAQAQDMVSFGQARDMAHALAAIRREDPEAASLARRAMKVGPNRARKRYRQAHPELARFYADIAA